MTCFYSQDLSYNRNAGQSLSLLSAFPDVSGNFLAQVFQVHLVIPGPDAEHGVVIALAVIVIAFEHQPHFFIIQVIQKEKNFGIVPPYPG